MRGESFLGCAIGLLGLIACVLGATQDGVDYQALAEDERWDWREEMCNPVACLRECGNKYDIRLASFKDNRRAIMITIMAGEKEIYSWKGHAHTVFRIVDDRLYYAKFDPECTGGAIVAVDLTNGKELWTSALKGLPVHAGTLYVNRPNMEYSREVIAVYGCESVRRYIEFKRADTGDTIGHKILPREK